MKRFSPVITVMLLLFVFSVAMADYMTSFSAAVKNWNESNIENAISLVQLSLSSTVNVSYAPDLWYFRSRLELMLGKTSDAEKSLETAVSVFHPKAVYKFLNALAQASVTSFSPVAQVTYENELKGFYSGEVFYSPVSVAMRNTNYYVLDEANDFVEEFGTVQRKIPLSAGSTPTSMVYSSKTDTFFISFEDGKVYEYNSNFSTYKLFASGFSYPIVSYVDNAGRVYISNEGKDSIVVLENDGSVFRTFLFFKSNRVHIIGYIRECCGVMYVMDFTDKEIRKFDIVTKQELTPIPFPKGEVPSSFELLGSTVIFVSSHKATVGGIDFPLQDGGVFSSSFAGRLLMVCDIEKNAVKMYEIFTHSNLFLPIIDRTKFVNGKAKVFFRVLDPMGKDIENANQAVVMDNGFTKAITVSKISIPHKLYIFPKTSIFFHMDKNIKNIVIMKASTLKGQEKSFFSAILLNNVCLYLVEDTDLTKLEKELVKLTHGDVLGKNEVSKAVSFSANSKAFEFQATYSIALPQGIDEINLMYGGSPTFVDSTYYTLQNVLK